MDGYRGEFLKTLRLVPDEIILSLGTRDIELVSSTHCVCGWIARELRGQEQNVAAEESSNRGETVLATLDRKLKGKYLGWMEINGAWGGESIELELAFVDRLDECVA